jgi:hypothetical protein
VHPLQNSFGFGSEIDVVHIMEQADAVPYFQIASFLGKGRKPSAFLKHNHPTGIESQAFFQFVDISKNIEEKKKQEQFAPMSTEEFEGKHLR